MTAVYFGQDGSSTLRAAATAADYVRVLRYRIKILDQIKKSAKSTLRAKKMSCYKRTSETDIVLI